MKKIHFIPFFSSHLFRLPLALRPNVLSSQNLFLEVRPFSLSHATVAGLRSGIDVLALGPPDRQFFCF